MDHACKPRHRLGESYQTKISSIVEDMQQQPRIETSITLTAVAKHQSRGEYREGPQRRMGPEMSQRKRQRRAGIGQRHPTPGALPPRLLAAVALEITTEEHFFESGVPDDEQAEGGREYLGKRQRVYRHGKP